MAKEKTPEELEAEVQAEQEAVDAKVDAAGEVEKKKAQAAGLSEEEVNKRVEAARTEEKDKLYPQIEELTKAVKEVQAAFRAEQKEKERIQKEAEEEQERQRQETLTSEDKQKETLARIEEQLKEEREARLRSEAERKTEKRHAELKEYRRNAIQAVTDAGEKLLPELVQGDTEAEIDDSIINAKARYAELAEQFKAELGTSTRGGMPRPTSPSIEALEDEELSEQLNQVDPVKYRTDPDYRDAVQAELANTYARSQGRV